MKTTSGKLRRKTCQSKWQSGELKTLFTEFSTANFEYLRIEPVTPSLEQIIRDIIFAVTRMTYGDDSPIQMDSLAVVQVIGMIQTRTGVSIPAQTFATEAPTIQTIIRYLENQKGSLRILDSRIVNLNSRKEGSLLDV